MKEVYVAFIQENNYETEPELVGCFSSEELAKKTLKKIIKKLEKENEERIKNSKEIYFSFYGEENNEDFYSSWVKKVELDKICY